MTREDNRAKGYTYVYVYDNAGNITAKKTYAFTTGTLGTVQSTINYTYGDSSWRDLLTKYGATSITYDTIGNPTAIGEQELSWKGRQLTSLYDGEYITVDYAYNADGIRTFNEVYDADTGDTTRHEYILSGSQIIKETVFVNNVESYTLVYLYDENGSPIGYRYRTPSYASGVFDGYFFEKNLQGDIIAVYNHSGTKLISYTYDAWGSTTTAYLNGGGSTAARLNPFRYRDYYFDSETGFYYLQSRYYNPNWGRFLSADDIAFLGANGELKGYNLYSYCGNSPINFTDSSGNFLCTAIGAIIGGLCSAGAAWIEGKSPEEIKAAAYGGMVAGAIAGLAADVIAVTGGTAAVVIGVSAAAGAIGSFAGSLTESAVLGEDFSDGDVWLDAGVDALWGGAFGALGGVMTGPVTSMMDEAMQHAGKKLIQKGGVTFAYAAGRAFKNEIKDLVASIVEEILSNFTSWYTQTYFEAVFDGGN